MKPGAVIISCGGCINRSATNKIIDAGVCEACKKEAIEAHNQT